MPLATENCMVRNGPQTADGRVYRADFDATLAELFRVCTELSALAAARAGAAWSAEIDLGLTEVLTNVVKHGYGKQGIGRITVTCVESRNEWVLTVDDQGAPIPDERLRAADGSVFAFDPQDIHGLPEGGMGLSLVRRCFDRMVYEVGDNGNRMLLAKQIPPPHVRGTQGMP